MRLNEENLNSYSDEQLLQLSLDNDIYFSIIIKRYKEKFFYYLKAFTGLRDDDLEDIVQDSFIKMYRNLNSFNPKLKFSSWAYRIVHNQAIDDIRRRKKDNLALLPEMEIFDDKNDLIVDLDLKFQKNIVSQVLQELKREYREVLVLRFFKHQEYKEISDILRKPIGTVCTLISRAKADFKDKYQKYVK